MVYTYGELITLVGPDLTERYVGDATIGYKVAICQRDVATYGTILLAGLVFFSKFHQKQLCGISRIPIQNLFMDKIQIIPNPFKISEKVPLRNAIFPRIWEGQHPLTLHR